MAGCCKDDQLADANEVEALAVQVTEDWVRNSDAGKEWLAKLAAEVGAPLQGTLPLGAEEEPPFGGGGCC